MCFIASSALTDVVITPQLRLQSSLRAIIMSDLFVVVVIRSNEKERQRNLVFFHVRALPTQVENKIRVYAANQFVHLMDPKSHL